MPITPTSTLEHVSVFEGAVVLGCILVALEFEGGPVADLEGDLPPRPDLEAFLLVDPLDPER